MWKLHLCSNGQYYLYKNNEIYQTKTNEYIQFDKFNKDDADDLIAILNKTNNTNHEIGTKLKEIKQLKKENHDLKQMLHSILFEVKREENKPCEVHTFVSPHHFNMISEVLRNYDDYEYLGEYEDYKK